VDRDGRASIDLGVTGAPETFLVDAKGLVIAKRVGALSPQDAEALMEQARASSR
jgi:cytochrome c biogenesis protein CcmG/thiol:disulfide interchange protein DsbE